MLHSNIVRNKTIFVNIMSTIPSKFNIYTDGGCLNNGKKNAICSIGIHFPESNLIPIQDVSKVLDVKKASNNVAELTAIKRSLEIFKSKNIKIPLNIYSDSKYSINCITKWYPTWKKNNIVKTKKNHELITDIVNIYESINNIQFHYIEAHSGKKDQHSIGNEIADRLASQALFEYSNKFEQFNKLKSKPGDITQYFNV